LGQNTGVSQRLCYGIHFAMNILLEAASGKACAIAYSTTAHATKEYT